MVKTLPANAVDVGSIPGLGRSPGRGNGTSLQDSCLENPHGQRRLAGYSPWGHNESGHDLGTKQQDWGTHLLPHRGRGSQVLVLLNRALCVVSILRPRLLLLPSQPLPPQRAPSWAALTWPLAALQPRAVLGRPACPGLRPPRRSSARAQSACPTAPAPRLTLHGVLSLCGRALALLGSFCFLLPVMAELMLTHRDRYTQTHIHGNTERDRYTHRHTHTDTQTHTDTETHIHRNTHTTPCRG